MTQIFIIMKVRINAQLEKIASGKVHPKMTSGITWITQTGFLIIGPCVKKVLCF